jgi:hypothetical protein
MFVPAMVPAASRTAARIEWSLRCRMTCKPAAIVSVRPIPGKECLPMALIKPRSRGKRLVRHRTRLDHETNETLYAYARFIGESTEYVLNQVIDNLLARDKEFQQWRATNPESCAPASSSNDRRTRRVNRRPQAAASALGSHHTSASGSVDAH